MDDLDGTVPPYLLRRARRQAELKGIHLEGSEGKRQLRPPSPPAPRDFLWRTHRLVLIESEPDRVVADVAAALSA